jgi:ribosomal protein L33
MSKNLYLKADGDNGYFEEKPNSFCDPDKLEWCKFCAHCGQLINFNVCASENALSILLGGVPIVAQNGHCDKFTVPDKNVGQYSKIKNMILKAYGVEMARNRE